MTSELEAIAALLADTTPRPWFVPFDYDAEADATAIHAGEPDSINEGVVAWTVREGTPSGSREETERNAALIVAAVNALPVLLDALRAAEEREARLRSEVRDAVNDLALYGDHRQSCGVTGFVLPVPECSCGFDVALAREPRPVRTEEPR